MSIMDYCNEVSFFLSFFLRKKEELISNNLLHLSTSLAPLANGYVNLSGKLKRAGPELSLTLCFLNIFKI